MIISLLLATYSIAMVQGQEEILREETLIIQMHSKPVIPTNFNPFVVSGRTTVRYAMLALQTPILWMINSNNGTIDFIIAEGFEYNEDYSELTVRLREEAEWSDGVSITSADLEFSLEILMENPGFYGGGAGADISSIEVIDDKTLVIKLKGPNPRYHLKLDSQLGVISIIVPKHIWEGEDPAEFENYPPVGTGSYELVKSAEEEQVWRRNDDWWGIPIFGKPAPKYVIWRYVTEQEALAMQMSSHNLDWAGVQVATYTAIKEQNPYIEPWGGPYVQSGMESVILSLELNYRVYPFNIPEVRKAMYRLIDQMALIDSIWMGMAVPGEMHIAPSGLHDKYHELIQPLMDEYEPMKYDPDEALAIFNSLGYEKGSDGIWVTDNGTRITLDVIGPSGAPANALITEIAAQVWADFGIDTTYKGLDWGVFVSRRNSGDFGALSMWPYTPSDPYEEWSRQTTETSRLGYNNPEFDALVEAIKAVPYDMDDPYVRSLYYDATEHLFRDRMYHSVVAADWFGVKDTYYWTGFATHDNPYCTSHPASPITAWQTFRIESTGRLPPGLVIDPILGRTTQTVQQTLYGAIGVVVIVVVAIGAVMYRRRK
jgi:peptide/nickel transport system substrate-binding protein